MVSWVIGVVGRVCPSAPFPRAQTAARWDRRALPASASSWFVCMLVGHADCLETRQYHLSALSVFEFRPSFGLRISHFALSRPGLTCIKAPNPRPGYLDGVMNEKIVTLDVRADIRAGRQPCSSIMGAAAGLKVGESLRLLAPFEPKPLFEVLGQQGFAHKAQPLGGGDWEVLFFRDATVPQQTVQTPASQSSAGCGGSCDAPSELEVDARGLEPPQPMVKILEALDGLPAATRLHARTDRRPMHLYPLLEARGFAGESEEQSDGSFITHIRHR